MAPLRASCARILPRPETTDHPHSCENGRTHLGSVTLVNTKTTASEEGGLNITTEKESYSIQPNLSFITKYVLLHRLCVCESACLPPELLIRVMTLNCGQPGAEGTGTRTQHVQAALSPVCVRVPFVHHLGLYSRLPLVVCMRNVRAQSAVERASKLLIAPES